MGLVDRHRKELEKDILDQLPRAYTKELYEAKCDVVYQHFYESYMGQGQSVYAVN
ncbi:hypothetical protein [Paludibaculum fermentans]|uniref:hypothetical protein n=1 Tax=Paludibaculum fermentans TaxID=1473598 RepID=UPI003EBF448A